MMKSVLVAIVLWVAWFLWRKQRSASRKAEPPRGQAEPGTAGRSGVTASQDMVKCPVCGVHVPQADTVAGHSGTYCSESHRHQAEG